MGRVDDTFSLERLAVWRNVLFVAKPDGRLSVMRFTQARHLVEVERIVSFSGREIRELVTGPDGTLYVTTADPDDNVTVTSVRGPVGRYGAAGHATVVDQVPDEVRAIAPRRMAIIDGRLYVAPAPDDATQPDATPRPGTPGNSQLPATT